MRTRNPETVKIRHRVTFFRSPSLKVTLALTFVHETTSRRCLLVAVVRSTRNVKWVAEARDNNTIDGNVAVGQLDWISKFFHASGQPIH